jgi:N,N-dimethylformamidase
MAGRTSARVSRRTVLRGAQVAAAATVLAPAAGAGRAAAAGPTYDPNQLFVRLVPGGQGFIYAIRADGVLLLYRHVDFYTGGTNWINNGTGLAIGTEWQQFQTVLSGLDGQLFGLRADGTLLWYRYVVSDTASGAGSWAARSGSVIGTGFNTYPRVFGGWGGRIFGLDRAGNLFFYRYLAGDGTNGSGAWQRNGAGAQVGSGWQPFIRVWADELNVVFGIRQGGELNWWRYLADDGSNGAGAWANGGIAQGIGSAWGDDFQKEWFSNGYGTVYTVRLDQSANPGLDGTLVWYRLDNYLSVGSGGASWVNGGSGVVVGSGFPLERSAALQGYASDLSVPQGATVGFPVSTTFPSYTASFIRMAPQPGDAVTVVGPSSHTGRLQLLPSGYRSAGCRWGDDLTLTVPPGWPSGVYALRLEGRFGLRHDIPFVVRPASPSADVAFLLPTNTYNAYNYWGGHNQYTTPAVGGRRTVTFLRPSTSTVADTNGVISHTLISDLFLLRWMTANGIGYDCYHDGDLHGDGSWLLSYKALVLASHPEYWTDTMRSNLVDFLDNGGRLIYSGGNGLYERVEFSGDGNALTFRDSGGNRDLYRNHGMPESDILGVNMGGEYMIFRPYQVVAGTHPFFAGAGLPAGARFGSTGYNIAAAGWEVDQVPDSPLHPTTVLAVGADPADPHSPPPGGATMVYVDRGTNGSWVFSASSIAFNGALSGDTGMSKLLKNVFNAAVS